MKLEIFNKLVKEILSTRVKVLDYSFCMKLQRLIVMKSRKPFPFFDCPVTVRSLKDCHFSNVNLIHTENEIFTNNGYHFETPAIDISKFGIKLMLVLRRKKVFMITQSPQNPSN